MNPIDKLASYFEKFPGIGPRQARRFVQYLLHQSNASRFALAEEIRALGAGTAQCRDCFRWFAKSRSVQDGPVCEICANERRDASVLFVVEKDADLEPVERSNFLGRYFVLGGTMPLGEEHPQKFVRSRELVARVERDGISGTLKELILGLSATTEGDHTRLLLQEELQPLAGKFGFKISSLGRGLSTGSELEYADPDTISEALGSRR
ncbi:MAG: toprim domain-containing protein [Minisyncoccia bacterium]